MAPTTATLLSAWEAGAAEAPLDRAPSLLRRLGSTAPDAGLDQLTVGQCDALLFKLRRELFGDVLEAVATCPGCGSDVELSLSVSELQPPLLEAPIPPATLEHSGCTVAFRPPRNEDLRALAASGAEAGLSALVERCVIEARGADGRAVTVTELPSGSLEAIVAAMAASDPGAQTELRIPCPCGAEWVDELDIRSVVWTDLTDWVGRTLSEVHQLARAYGWSEAEILSMAAWRRRWYLEAAGC
jgi:hypothetical protein